MSEFAARDCDVLAVVADPPERNAQVIRDLGLEFPILSDVDLMAADAYDLRHEGAGPEGSDIARPASFLVDRDGVVRWRDVTENYRLRPHPDVVLARLDEIRR